MARLIDADKLKQIVHHKAFDMAANDDIYNALRWVMNQIDKQPTAYDVEKVVEELESDERHTFDGCINKRYTTEIVRKGGVE